MPIVSTLNSVLRRGLSAAKRLSAEHLPSTVTIMLAGHTVHSVPVFDGKESRRHRSVSLRELRWTAAKNLHHVPAMLEADTVVLFAGYPRSGHSLVGAIIDAHPAGRVSHELDLLWLVRHGLRWPEIVALIHDNAQAFRENGQWWNGYRYRIAGTGSASRLRVVGDKKGDWSVRHVLEDPSLLDRLRRRVGDRRIVFVVVTRDPFDNVATMTLRKSRRYDQLRIKTGDNRHGDLPSQVSEEMISDYRRLSDGVTTLSGEVETLVVSHEELINHPADTVRRIYDELGLDASEALVDEVSELVQPRANRTSDRVAWTAAQVGTVDDLIARSPHLAAYARTERPRPRDVDREVSLLSCVGVDNSTELLGPFIDHYQSLGIEPANMHVILNTSDAESEGLVRATELLAERGVSAEHVWVGPYHSAEMWRRRRDLQRAMVGLAGWIVNADVDEFNIFPDGIEPVVEFLRDNGFLGVQGPMIDRLTADGSLPELTPHISPFEQFPREGDLMTRLPQDVDLAEGAGTCNLILHAACVLPSPGGHGVSLDFTKEWLQEIAEQEGCTPRRLLRHQAFSEQVRRRWTHVLNNRLATLHGTHLRNFPRIRDSHFRFTFPIYSAHFKWHAGFRRDLEDRIARGDQSRGAARYSLALHEQFESNGWKVPPGLFQPRVDPAPTDWAAHAEDLRAYRRAIRPVLNHGRRQRRDGAAAREGWSVRQLTAGTGIGIGHMHCYYDIPVLNQDESRLVAMELTHHSTEITPEHRVRVGVVDVDRGGFEPLAETTAWSWQQGPMAQWIPGRDQVIFNVREGDGLGARIIDLQDGTRGKRLARPIYALARNGRWGTSVDLQRLDGLRPGYGYASARRRDLVRAPDDDGVWRVDLSTGEQHLILSISQAVEAVIAQLHRRDPTLSEELRTERFHFWFNHVKLSPDDRRLTCKLRWRHPDGPWSDHQGVSVTMDVEGEDASPHLLATATSHVMWWTAEELYYWDAAAKDVRVVRDLADETPRSLGDGHFDRNVHLRHLSEDPSVFIYDEPYRETVTLHRLDLSSGKAVQVARFPFHNPSRGLYRCDLHPVPNRAGDRVIVSSLTDGRRQVYCVERTDR